MTRMFIQGGASSADAECAVLYRCVPNAERVEISSATGDVTAIQGGTRVSRPFEAATAAHVARWWSIVRPDATILLDGAVVPSNLLLLQTNCVWSDGGVQIYQHEGPALLYWISAVQGVYATEALPSAVDGTYAVYTEGGLPHEQLAKYREAITTYRPSTWRLPPQTQDSSSLAGKLAVADCRSSYQPLITATAEWVRTILPQYKCGVSSHGDVALKLDLERRLRVEEGVTGSLRPLALTLEAIEEVTFAWPGLWLVSGTTKDFRPDLPALLGWDAVLYAVAAITKLHAEFKPGLVYGSAVSQIVPRQERRFSKRDAGVVDAMYVQVNPVRLMGPAPVVAARLIQAASHELAHLSLAETVEHSETFVSRREYVLSCALELMPAVERLVTVLGLDMRPAKTLSVPPITMPCWLEEQLGRRQYRPVEQLNRSWAAVRHLTAGRAMTDVASALQEAAHSGFCVLHTADSCEAVESAAPRH